MWNGLRPGEAARARQPGALGGECESSSLSAGVQQMCAVGVLATDDSAVLARTVRLHDASRMDAAMTLAWYANHRDPDWRCDVPAPAALTFHRTLPGYLPTPLVELPTLAAEFGVAHVFAKDESSRLGLPAFKALGASWAVHRALAERAADARVTVMTATDGNHGRAVARFSRLAGQAAHIFIPVGVSDYAIDAIRGEGAQVTIVDGNYDDAVATAARAAEAPDTVLVQDTAWEGYERVPGWIVEGYATMFAEVDGQLAAAGIDHADLVAVPTGVGALLQAALAHYRCTDSGTAVMSVEALASGACMGPSLAAGHPVTVEMTTTIMAGLNCGTPSLLAWPFVQHGLDAAVAVTDEEDIRAAHDLAAIGVTAGPCGASGLAGLRVALHGDGNEERRAHLGIEPASTLVIIVTEGSAANPVPARPSGH